MPKAQKSAPTAGMPMVSGILNNSAFNCAIPEILKKIAGYGEIERRAGKAFDPIYPADVNFLIFKNLFADYYGLSKRDRKLLTWIDFKEFLESYSFSEQEFVLAPIFRRFYADRQQDASASIRSCKGRYPVIDLNDAYAHFYVHLGIGIRSHSEHDGVKEFTPPSLDVAPMVEIEYGSTAHFSLLNEDKKQDVIKGLSPKFREVFEHLSNFISEKKTTKALNVLKEEVHDKLHASLGLSVTNHANTLKNLGSSFEFKCMVGLTLAGAGLLVLALLMPMPFLGISASLAGLALLGGIGLFAKRCLSEQTFDGQEFMSPTPTPAPSPAIN